MKPGIIAAIVVSAVLISGAFFLQRSAAPETLGLTAVENNVPLSDAQYKELLAKFSSPASATATAEGDTSSTLTTSDMVGRQLILDYISLAQRGETSEDNLSTLVERYVESIPSIAATAGISILDLKTVANSPSTFLTYSVSVRSIYETYSSSFKGAYSAQAEVATPQGAAMAQKMSTIYAQTAEKLKATVVPAALATAHLSLINIYMQDASAMAALAHTTTDPTSSFAGLIAVKQNAEKEREALAEIEAILTKNGI